MPRRPPPSHASIADARCDIGATLDVVPDAAARTCWACGAASEPGESLGWLLTNGPASAVEFRAWVRDAAASKAAA